MKLSTFVTLLSAAAPGVLSKVIEFAPDFVPNLDQSIANTKSAERFADVNVQTLALVHNDKKRQAEPDPNRNVTLQDGLVFTLMCVDAGFRGRCLSLGSGPGECVSFFSFQSGNDTSLSNTFNDQVSSLSTNTGGNCQFYKYVGCNVKGDDRGLTSNYNYNLAFAPPGDDRVPEYDNQITSWRC